jgi:hypothetical protein
MYPSIPTHFWFPKQELFGDKEIKRAVVGLTAMAGLGNMAGPQACDGVRDALVESAEELNGKRTERQRSPRGRRIV